MEKLKTFNGRFLTDLPPTVQQHFATRPAKVITLNDKSDDVVRYDLFERLNTGGVPLTPQEIRDCVFRGKFADHLEHWSKDANFGKVVRLTKLQQSDATAEECVSRFFAFRSGYRRFDHAVNNFLSDFMRGASANFDYVAGEKIFATTFAELAKAFPHGIRRPGGKMTTPLNLYEGIAVGASLALDQAPHLITAGLQKWLASAELRRHTTGATNDKSAVRGRIEFCRDRFLGKP